MLKSEQIFLGSLSGFSFTEIVAIQSQFRAKRLAEQETQDGIQEIVNTLVQQEREAIEATPIHIEIVEDPKAFRCFHFDRLPRRIELAKLRDRLGLPKPSKIHEILRMRMFHVDEEVIHRIYEIS